MNSHEKILTEPPQLAPQDVRRLIESKGQFPLVPRETTLGDYWRILLKRKWTVAACVVALVIVAVIVSLYMTPVYEASVRISVGAAQSLLSFKDSPMQPLSTDPLQIETQSKILQSASLASQVIQKLQLDRNKDFGGAPTIRPGDTRRNAIYQEALLGKFRKNLHVQQVPSTTLIEIRFSNKNAELSAQIANTVASAFIERTIKTSFDSTMQASEWLSKQHASLQAKVEDSQGRLVEYQRTHGIIGVDDKQNLTFEKLNELNKELTLAQADRIVKYSLYQLARDSGENANAVLQDAVLTNLRQQQVELQAQRAQLSTQFGPSYPKVQEIDNRLGQVEKSFKEQLGLALRKLLSDYDSSVKREEMLKSALEVQKAEAEKLNENAVQYKVLKQEADSTRQLYDGLLQKLNEASLLAGLNSSNIVIVDPARIPVRPAMPNVPLNLGFALLLGLLGGVAGAFALEALDTTVRTPEQAEQTTGLPTIGLIPALSSFDRATQGKLKSRLFRPGPLANPTPVSRVSFLQPKSEIAEAYRVLRTAILLSSAGHQPCTILVTSAQPQDGKSVTSINTAIVLAQQGKRVLLVDADMRRPSVHKGLGMPKNVIGLSNLLTGGASAEDTIVSTFQTNLYVLPAGPLAPQPSELLGSKLMRELLDKWRQEYDHVIIDSPPVITVTDAVLLSVMVDAVILVTRSGQTTLTALRRSCELLAYVKAKVMGVVVNAVDLSSPDYYYYYYSGSRYGGYYGDKRDPILKPGSPDAEGADVAPVAGSTDESV